MHGDQNPLLQRLVPPTVEVREDTVEGDLRANARYLALPLKSAARKSKDAVEAWLETSDSSPIVTLASGLRPQMTVVVSVTSRVVGEVDG